MKNLMIRFVREEEGQDLIEYALLCAIVAIGAIVGMEALAGGINDFFTSIADFLDTQQPG